MSSSLCTEPRVSILCGGLLIRVRNFPLTPALLFSCRHIKEETHEAAAFFFVKAPVMFKSAFHSPAKWPRFNVRLSTRSLRQPSVCESRVPIFCLFATRLWFCDSLCSFSVLFFLICKEWETCVQDSARARVTSQANSSDMITDNS